MGPLPRHAPPQRPALELGQLGCGEDPVGSALADRHQCRSGIDGRDRSMFRPFRRGPQGATDNGVGIGHERRLGLGPSAAAHCVGVMRSPAY